MFATLFFIVLFAYLATGTIKNIIQAWKLLDDKQTKKSTKRKLAE